jgi:hypothetical protein
MIDNRRRSNLRLHNEFADSQNGDFCQGKSEQFPLYSGKQSIGSIA